MQRTRRQTLVLLAGATGLVGWILLRAAEQRGISVPPVPWLVAVAFSKQRPRSTNQGLLLGR